MTAQHNEAGFQTGARSRTTQIVPANPPAQLDVAVGDTPVAFDLGFRANATGPILEL
jgi:hypothetical protein